MKKLAKIKKKWFFYIVFLIFVFLVLIIHQVAFKKAIDDFPAMHNLQFHTVANKKNDIQSKTFKVFEKIEPLYRVFLAQPEAIKQIFKLSMENVSVYHYVPDVQSELSLKYMQAIKDARIQNQKWVNAYESHLKVIKARYNIDFNTVEDGHIAQEIFSFIQELNTLNQPEELEFLIDQFFTNEISEKDLNAMVNTLGKRYKGHLKTTDILEKIDRKFEVLQSDFLIEAHKKNSNSLWQRIIDKVQAFFYQAIPMTDDTMDMEMIDKTNNDL
jgi:hypothetical protein